MTRSTQPPRRAAQTPRAADATALTMTAPRTRIRVTCSRVMIAVVTGWFVNHELPKLPVRACPSQEKYREISGLFRPSCWFLSATVAWVAVGPRIVRPTLPAAAYSSR